MSDSGLYEWMALRRVAGGGVGKVAGVYLDHGRPVPQHLIQVFDRLVWDGLLVVAEGDPVWELRRISLTEVGQARFEGLGREYGHNGQPGESGQGGNEQHKRLEVPPPEFRSGKN